MAAPPARLRDAVTALAAVRFDQAQIVDGRVMDPDAAALILQAVQAHLRVLVDACLPAPKADRGRAVGPVDTAGMTDAQLFAYYKRTAPTEDLRFFLRGRLSDGLRRRAEAITKPTAADLVLLRDAWRTERLAEERAAGIPAIGTAEWHARYNDTTPAEDLPAGDADRGQQTEALS
jgi:hypothetical protein